MPTPGGNHHWSCDPRYTAFAAAGHRSDNPDGMALFSSRGPAGDGRLKPEVVAPGTNILSVRSAVHDPVYIGERTGTQPLWGDVRPKFHPLFGKYCWSGGTSMAAPLVAGLVALIRQHLVEQRGHHQDRATPSGALLKAFVVNGAVPIAGQYPGEVPAGRQNNVTGFGRVHLAESVDRIMFSDDATLALASGQRRTFQVRATDIGQPLKFTLAWIDPPGQVGHGLTQNLLYLQVVPPGGRPIDGDVISFDTMINTAQANNTQQIVVAAAEGTYEILVRGINVPIRSAGAGAPPGAVQDFALVVSGAVQQPTSALNLK